MAMAKAPRQEIRHKTMKTKRMSPEMNRVSRFPRFFAVGVVLRFVAGFLLADFFATPVLG
jgi:hypothetical protein